MMVLMRVCMVLESYFPYTLKVPAHGLASRTSVALAEMAISSREGTYLWIRRRVWPSTMLTVSLRGPE